MATPCSCAAATTRWRWRPGTTATTSTSSRAITRPGGGARAVGRARGAPGATAERDGAGGVSAPTFDLLTMGRSSIDLYAQNVGVAFEDIQGFAAYVGGSPLNIA